MASGGSYSAVMRELGCIEKQEVGKWKNNRAENSHLPFRQREYAIQRFRKLETPEKFTSIHSQIYTHFTAEQHLNKRQAYKNLRSEALSEWRSLVECEFGDISHSFPYSTYLDSALI